MKTSYSKRISSKIGIPSLNGLGGPPWIGQNLKRTLARFGIFVQELWRLHDPLRQAEMASGLQLVLSHVISLTQKLDELNALKDTLEYSNFVAGSSMSQAQDSPLASAAGIRAIGIGISAALGPTSPNDATNISSVSPPQASSLRTVDSYPKRSAINLVSADIRDFISTRRNPEMGTGNTMEKSLCQMEGTTGAFSQ